MSSLTLSKTYSSVAGSVPGLPVIDRVDPRIFSLTYQGDCLGCRYCFDLCCSFGAQLDPANVDRLMAAEAALEAYIGVPRQLWITTRTAPADAAPDEHAHRTAVLNGACVFLDRHARGCKLHRYAIEHGRDVHALKPAVCSFFPVMYDHGLLRPAYEINAAELVCLGPGTTLYRGSRATLAAFYSDRFIAELDSLERQQTRAAA